MLFKRCIIVFLCLFSQLSVFAKGGVFTNEKEAAAMISFSNDMLKEYRVYKTMISEYEDMLEDMDLKIALLRRGSKDENVIVCPKSSTQTDLLGAVNSFSAKQELPGIEDLRKLLSDNELHLKELQQWSDQADRYFRESWFQADADNSVYRKISDKLTVSLETIDKNWDRIYYMMKVLGGNAEVYVLNGTEMSEYVVPMKSCMMRLNSACYLLKRGDYLNADQNIKSLESLIFDFSLVSDKNKKKLKDPSCESNINGFIEEMNKALTFVRNYSSALKKKSETSDELENEISKVYNKAKTEYNNFAKCSK